jgi:hypothetical protein
VLSRGERTGAASLAAGRIADGIAALSLPLATAASHCAAPAAPAPKRDANASVAVANTVAVTVKKSPDVDPVSTGSVPGLSVDKSKAARETGKPGAAKPPVEGAAVAGSTAGGYDAPPGALTCRLHPHQRAAVEWMLAVEEAGRGGCVP